MNGLLSGPWFREGRFVYALIDNPGPLRFEPMVNRFSCHVQRDNSIISEEEAQSIARLIAAAPDLLRALNEYQEARDGLFSHCLSNGIFNAQGDPVDCTKINQAHLSATAAIEKAIGAALIDNG